MQSKILENKRTVIKNGEEIIDLTTASIRWKDDRGIIINTFFVGDDMVMRPDLVSYVAYKNTDNFDIILKFNGISNPFSIDTDNFILVPDLGYMKDSMTEPKRDSVSNAVRNQYLDPNKTRDIDSNKNEYDKLVSDLYKKTRGVEFSENPLPPNFADEGDKEGRVREDGSIILGSDVTK